MSRTNTLSRSSSPYEAEGEADTMPSGLHKSKRSNKATKKKPTIKADSMSSPQVGVIAARGAALQYRPVSEKKAAIESWNDDVPPKLARPTDEPNDNDPIIRAYLEAKMELFRSAGRVEEMYGSVYRDGSVCSRKS